MADDGETFSMTDDKLIRDEAQRSANYEAIKADLKADLRNEIAVDTQRVSPANVADELQTQAINEVVETRREVERGRVAARVSQVIDYIFFVIYGLLAIRLMLELFAAREGVAFFRFIKSVTDPFYWPFRGLVPSPSTPDGFSLELPIIVAIVVYALLHMAINGIFRMIAHRKVEI